MIHRLAATLTIATVALGLTACTAGSGATDERAQASASASRQAWADAKINRWLGAIGARNIDALRDPENKIESWESPEEGVLVVHFGQNAWSNNVGSYLWGVLQDVDDAPDRLVLISENGTRYTYPPQ